MIYYTDQICIEANVTYQCRIWSGKLLSKAMTDGLQILQTLQHVQLQRRYLIQTHTHNHAHTHDSNNFSPPAARCGSWSAASVNWLSAEKEEEEGGRISRRPRAAEEVKTYWKSVHHECFCPIWARHVVRQLPQPFCCWASSHTEKENVNCTVSTLSTEYHVHGFT